jgi:hypothetical protein
MPNISTCPQCGHFDQTKSISAIAQGRYTVNATVDGKSVSGEGRSNLSDIFKRPKPFDKLEYILSLPYSALIWAMLSADIIWGKRKSLGLARSYTTIIPNDDYQAALNRYNESLYCARCGLVFHPNSGDKRIVTKDLDEYEWNIYLYNGPRTPHHSRHTIHLYTRETDEPSTHSKCNLTNRLCSTAFRY